MRGQIIDAIIVAAPEQRDTKAKSTKIALKDRDARRMVNQFRKIARRPSLPVNGAANWFTTEAALLDVTGV
jgi:hypothetical protein